MVTYTAGGLEYVLKNIETHRGEIYYNSVGLITVKGDHVSATLMGKQIYLDQHH